MLYMNNYNDEVLQLCVAIYVRTLPPQQLYIASINLPLQL